MKFFEEEKKLCVLTKFNAYTNNYIKNCKKIKRLYLNKLRFEYLFLIKKMLKLNDYFVFNLFLISFSL